MKLQLALGIVVLFATSACSTRTTVAHGGEVSTVVLRETVNELEKEPVPGTINEVWAEEMYDQVCLPGTLDPNATYYRKGHCTLVEVRKEKYQLIEYPDYDGKYAVPERPRGRMR